MLAIEAASIVDGEIDVDGHLILTTQGGTDIDAGSALPALPIASSTTQGIVELATVAEVISAIDALRAVTPASLATLLAMTGEIKTWAPPIAPLGWLFCNGASLLRTAEPNLFSSIAPALGTATITIASPGVITRNGHGLVPGDPVFFTTTDTLPTGLVANTVYYVNAVGITTNDFRVSATSGGVAINTTGSQSGVHTLRRCPFGIVDATHFSLPDARKRTLVGWDSTQTEFNTLGKAFGATTHSLIQTEMPSHTHVQNPHSHGITDAGHIHGQNVAANPGSGGTGTRADYAGDFSGLSAYDQGINTANHVTGISINSTAGVNINTGNGIGHNNVQPSLAVNFIIKT